MVTLVAGLPASGKSTVARRLFNSVLEYDSFADRLGSYEDLEAERELVNRQFALLAGSGRFDAVVEVFSSRASRARILEACPNAGIVLVRAPLQFCFRRNEMRQRSWISNDEILSIAHKFEPVSMDEGFSFIKYIDCFQENSMEEKVWLKIVGDKVEAYGDEETLNSMTNGSYDMVLTPEEWRLHGRRASIVDGRIVLADPEKVAFNRDAENIRNERYIRLRQCDKISPMRWNAMTDEEKKAWTEYRIALLNIPQQEGFPWGGDSEKVPWPKIPE